MVRPVFIELPLALREQIEERDTASGGGGLPRILQGRDLSNAHRERGMGRRFARRPMSAMAGAETDGGGRGAHVRVYRDGPGDYRAVAIVPWFYRDATGERRPCRFAIELKIDRLEDEVATMGADFGMSPAKVAPSILNPILDKVAAVLSHPATALAASASVLIPGVGPAYLVGYAIAQSLVDYAERNTR